MTMNWSVLQTVREVMSMLLNFPCETEDALGPSIENVVMSSLGKNRFSVDCIINAVENREKYKNADFALRSMTFL